MSVLILADSIVWSCAKLKLREPTLHDTAQTPLRNVVHILLCDFGLEVSAATWMTD